MTKATIERYFDEECLVPALKAVGHSRQAAARVGLHPHFENHYEIHLIMDGTVDWWVENEIYSLKPGSIFMTKPGELHGGVKHLIQRCTLTWLQFDPRELNDESIKQDFESIKDRHWQGASDLVEYVNIMIRECRRPKGDSGRIISAYLNLFLAQLLRQYKNRAVRPPVPPQFQALSNYIEASLDASQVITINDLCDHVDLRRSRIFQLFDQYVGQSPISYINSRRIERAKDRLRLTKAPITDIAIELGYASSQHFATVFKRITGLTPRDFRRSATQISQEVETWRKIGRQRQQGHE